MVIDSHQLKRFLQIANKPPNDGGRRGAGPRFSRLK
jgi:hypothetical protein